MRRILCGLMVICLSTAGAEVLTVTDVEVKTRYPWNGLVDIDVTFSAPGLSTISFAIKDTSGNTNLNAQTFYLGNPENGVRTLEVLPGTHRFVWDAAADLGEVEGIPFVVTAIVTAMVPDNIYEVNITGGSGSGSFVQGTTITLAAAAKTGYAFDRWTGNVADIRLLASATSSSTTFIVPSRDLEYVAAYKPNTYTVKFNANGGAGTMENQEFIYDTAQALMANAFTRTGYTFQGWAESASATTAKYADKQNVKNLVEGGARTLYAVWQGDKYTVVFKANGGSGTMSNESFTYDVAKALSANTFTRIGYTFMGWADSENATTVQYANKESVKNLVQSGTKYLYAVWSPQTFTVNFIANGGYGTMSSESFTYGMSKNLPANTFSRSGAFFVGWSTTGGSLVAYNDMQSVSNLTSIAGGSVNLYAVWVWGLPLYMVIDLSGGPQATSYPISYRQVLRNPRDDVEGCKTTKIVLRRIDAGSFIMGSERSVESHRVTLTQSFYMGIFELTQQQWVQVKGSIASDSCGYFRSDPVYAVSYEMIRGSVNGKSWPTSSEVDGSSFMGILRKKTGLSFDLPTEAQWEYACRAGTSTTYSFGDSVDDAYFWYQKNDASESGSYCMWPVGSKKPNPWGLYDMHGNVREWCLDWYGTLSYGRDPKGSASSSQGLRVVRGGGWINDMATGCTSSSRVGYEATGRSVAQGFRLSLTIE